MIKLTVGYSTLAERVGNIQLPEARADREILIIIQDPKNGTAKVPAAFAKRKDVRVINLSSYGVAKSRNEALRSAKGEYLIFADDDITFFEEGLDAAVAHLDASPTTAFLLGAAVDETGALRKVYPTGVTGLTKFNSAKAATYEMIVRVAASRDANVWFDEDFGAGAVNYLGDEYIFIADLINKKLRCEFAPITLAQHPIDSSGSGWGTERDVVARSKIFTRVFGEPLATLVRFGFGLKHAAGIGSARLILKFISGR